MFAQVTRQIKEVVGVFTATADMTPTYTKGSSEGYGNEKYSLHSC